MRIPTLLAIVLLCALWIASAMLYPDLPARLPRQFDFAGHVNHWAPSSFGSWFLIPLIAAAVAAVMLGLTVFLPRIPPGLINIPRKDEFLRLSAERRAGVLQVVQGSLAWIAVCMVALCAILQYAVYETANGRDAASLLRVVEFGPLVVITALVVQMWISVRRAIEDHSG